MCDFYLVSIDGYEGKRVVSGQAESVERENEETHHETRDDEELEFPSEALGRPETFQKTSTHLICTTQSEIATLKQTHRGGVP